MVPSNEQCLLDLMAHRGPDDRGSGFWRRDQRRQFTRCESESPYHLFLGHRRLSILDVSAAGHQPMTSSNDEIALVYNGEIYNFIELRNELSTRGYLFKSGCDTEVLMSAWLEWGPACLDRLMGMFSFCIADFRNSKLYAVRDPFGIKPLFMYEHEGTFAFSSELPPLLQLTGGKLEYNTQAIYDFLRWGLLEHTPACLINGIQRILPGHYAEIDLADSGQSRLIQYWTLPDREPRPDPSIDDAVELRKLLLQSVKLHLRSDVPIGFALSGGIDSSALVCLAHNVDPSIALHTFSYIPNDSSLSEETWIDIVNSHTNAVSHKISDDADTLESELIRATRFQGEPFSSTSILAQTRIYKEAANQGIKVLIDGQGGDEMFCGYPYQCAAHVVDLILSGKLWRALRLFTSLTQRGGFNKLSFLQLIGQELLPSKLHQLARKLVRRPLAPSWILPDQISNVQIHLDDRLRSRTKNESRFGHRLRSTIGQANLPDLLRYQDRNSMAHSVEARVPLLTSTLADFVFGLPHSKLVDPQNGSKALLRKALEGIVPEEIISRRDKIGFETPERTFLETFFPLIEALPQTHTLYRFVDRERLLNHARDVLNGKKKYHSSLWRAVSFAYWIDYAESLTTPSLNSCSREEHTEVASH